jgi:hypothetical protein
MPKRHNDDRVALDFVADLLVADEEAADLAPAEALEPRPQARIVQQPQRRSRTQGQHGARYGLAVHRGEELVEPDQVGSRLADSANPHQSGCGGGNSWSVPRLSARICSTPV